MKITVSIDNWKELKKMSWGAAHVILDGIETECRDEEAMGLIEGYMSADVLGCFPSTTELYDFIRYTLPDIMHLYDDDGDNDGEN